MPHRNDIASKPTHSTLLHAPPLASPTAAAVPAEAGTMADARARFGLARSTLYRLAATGDVRLLKVGSSTLVDFASVRAFLARAPAVGTHTATPQNDATPRG